MKIKKLKDTYGDYSLEISFSQLVAIKNALATDHADPVSDEMYAELAWYLQNIPGPGESEEDLKQAEEAAETGMDSPEAAENPLKTSSADEFLPAPGEGEGDLGDLGDLGGPGEGPPGEGGGEVPPSEPESEADRRLPPAPEE